MTDDEREAAVLAFRRALNEAVPLAHDTTRLPHPSAPEEEDEASLATHPLPPLRAPELSITNEVVKATTRESLRVMATETKKQTPIIEQAAAETAKQTPMIQAAAESAAKGASTTKIAAVANFVALVITGVVLGLAQHCQSGALQTPPGYVLVPTSVLLQRTGQPPAPAPASAPPPAAPPH